MFWYDWDDMWLHEAQHCLNIFAPLICLAFAIEDLTKQYYYITAELIMRVG